MEFIILLVFVLIFIAYIFVQVKMNDIRHRAKQTILKDTAFSSSNINAEIQNNLEKKQLEKFLNEHPEYTEEKIKDLLLQYAEQLINQNDLKVFTDGVNTKMQKDPKLIKMQDMKFQRINISHYANQKLTALLIYTDNRDEYNLILNNIVREDDIILEQYQISKGVAVGM